MGKIILNSQTKTKSKYIAGLGASDPTVNIDSLFEEVKSLGFIGIQNFPTVGLIDSSSYFRRCLEQTDMGYAREVEMIAKARRFGLLTTPYVLSEEEAVAMIRAGADIIVIHLGLTVGAIKGAKSADLNESVKKIRSIIQVVNRKTKEALFWFTVGLWIPRRLANLY